MRAHELTVGRTFGVTFDHGEDFFEALSTFCRDNGVRQGYGECREGQPERGTPSVTAVNASGWMLGCRSTTRRWSYDPKVGAFFQAPVAEDDEFVQHGGREGVEPYLVLIAVDQFAQGAAQLLDCLLRRQRDLEGAVLDACAVRGQGVGDLAAPIVVRDVVADQEGVGHAITAN